MTSVGWMKETTCGGTVTLPFGLDANGCDSLTNQLVDGIKTAVADGFYRPGDRLPTWRQLAKELGVSVRVPREAMRRLQKDGYVAKTGFSMSATQLILWRDR